MNLNKSNEEDIKCFIVGTYLFFMSIYVNNTTENYKNIDFSNEIYIEFYKYTYYVFKYYILSYIKKLKITEDETNQYELLDNIFYFIPDNFDDENINSENYYIKKYLQFLDYEEYMDIEIDEEYDNEKKRYQKIFDLMLAFYSYIECNILDD